MARRATAAPSATGRGKARKTPKPATRAKRTRPPSPAQELEAAHRRIRDLEELHKAIGTRLDAAISTIHKILGRVA